MPSYYSTLWGPKPGPPPNGDAYCVSYESLFFLLFFPQPRTWGVSTKKRSSHRPTPVSPADRSAGRHILATDAATHLENWSNGHSTTRTGIAYNVLKYILGPSHTIQSFSQGREGSFYAPWGRLGLTT